MMRNKLVVAIVAITMVTVFVPATSAEHLSVGATDTVGTEPRENPGAPSVEGDQPGADGSPYGVGTKAPSECYQPQPDVNADEASSAATSRGFCGHLYYNEGTDIQHVSPVDQRILDKDFIGTFDVQRTWFNGPLLVGPSGCLPMCNSTGQDALWDAFHDAGNTLGITDPPGKADKGQDGRFQDRSVRIDHTHPAGIIQRSADVWDMNGWTAMAPIAESFVGYLTDTDGNPITGDELRTKVKAMAKGTQLSDDTTPQICGYTPDRNFQGTATQSFCEVAMLYVPNDDEVGDAQSGEFTSYEEECESPTYVCGTTTGGYWESEAAGLVGAFAGRYQGEYTRWHWVVAPNQPDCGNSEPGFDFDADGAQMPYLAHDLDVYTPPQDVKGAGNVVSTEGPIKYANTLAAAGVPLPDLPGPVEDGAEQAQSTADDGLDPVTRGERVEPNNNDPISGLAENSQQAIVEDRFLGDDCAQLISDEDPDALDPWVNIADSTVNVGETAVSIVDVTADRSVSYRDPVVDTRTPIELARDTETVGVYGEDQDQDSSNDPTTSVYSTEGHVGLFTDKDDDGEYEQVTGPSHSASTFGAGVYGEKNIQSTGAYPMLWDMHASIQEGQPTVEPDQGCTFTGDRQFADVMQEAGYGPNTGLAQAIYLKEPTAFVDLDPTDPKQVSYPGGNNIYLLLNDAARNIWDGDASTSNGFALDEQVDRLVDNLRSHVVNNYGANAETLEVRQPGADLGLDSDYVSQCGESTGGFRLDLSFLHDCSLDCSGDTIATLYTFEATQDVLGGEDIPVLQINGEPLKVGTGQHTWIDVDPFDGNPDRNDDGTPKPPTS